MSNPLPAPDAEQAAAIAAAIERFLADTLGPTRSPGGDAPGGWARAARLEAVRDLDADVPHSWINT